MNLSDGVMAITAKAYIVADKKGKKHPNDSDISKKFKHKYILYPADIYYNQGWLLVNL